jgi:ABC-type transport system involved in multi-copper enzyme maturation permease subunit
MKFLAILQDSIREAIDAKVFYVMVGLSLLMTLLTLSITFTPVAGGRQVIQDWAILPLNTDAPDIGQARAMDQLFQVRPTRFEVTEVEPLEGEPDAATSTFKVKLKASFNTPDAAKKAKADPKAVETFIGEQFGLLEGRCMMEAADVHFTGWEGEMPLLGGLFGGGGGGLKGNFELEARPTPATFRFWPNRFSLIFGAWDVTGQAGFPLFQQLGIIENVLVGYIGSTIAVLVSIVISAFFIPNMLRKGSVDLLLVKPIGRVSLLLYKFVGGLTFIFLNTAVAVIGVWAALGLRSGVWAVSFLETILVLTFFFAILYSVSTVFGVITRSPISAILLTVGVWAVFFIIGFIHSIIDQFRSLDRMAQAIQAKLGDEGVKAMEGVPDGAPDNPQAPRPGQRGPRLEQMRFHENWFTQTIYVLHIILPRTNDLYRLTDRQIHHDLAFGEPTAPPEQDKPPAKLPGGIEMPQIVDKPPSLAEVVGVSGAFIAAMLAIACFWFATKDY